MISKLFTIIFLFLQLSTLLAAQSVEVYLLGGQSNMQGLGKIVDLPTDVPRKLPNTFFWNGQTFEPLVLGQTKTADGLTDFGPEVGFAIGTATDELPVYFIKYHASGMPLHHGWNSGKWIGGEPSPGRRNFYPGETAEDPNAGELYTDMRSRFQQGINDLSRRGLVPRVRGFIWMQGEADSKHEDSATSYATSLSRLRRRLAEDIEVKPDLPFVFGQVLPHEPALERFTHRKEIRQQMAACDSRSTSPEAMKNTTMVSTDGFSLLPDTVHYDTAGQIQLGKAFAEAMRKLVEQTER